MKYISFAAITLVFFALQTSLTSCNSSPNTTTLPGSWDKLGDFEGYPRTGASGFVINGIAYVGCGYNFELAGVAGASGRLKDFWKYDPNSDHWSRVADFPGSPRSGAVAFSLNGKGYVGTGLDESSNALSDFYEFDPAAGTNGKWKRIADLGYTAAQHDTTVTKRYGSLAFTVKNRAFVGGGHYVSDLKDLWEYDQTNNVWKQAPSLGGSKRQNGFVMVINDIAYVGGGSDNNQPARDFYKFDVTKLNPDGSGSPWTQLNGLTGKDANGNAIAQPKSKELASTFTIGNYGYVVCGSPASALGASNDTWQYDPSLDSWIQYFSFSTNTPNTGASRAAAIGFGIGDYGYIVTGGSGQSVKFDDCWQFNPSGVEPDNK
ncbi:MAG: galactose oxidase [Bacteroidetes bacterium]|nr:galactose oxidase [Bacteroidota bacterium]